jgi:hypothetical protein
MRRASIRWGSAQNCKMPSEQELGKLFHDHNLRLWTGVWLEAVQRLRS